MRFRFIGFRAESRHKLLNRLLAKRQTAGFTLLETLTALMILAIAMVALLDSYATGVRASGTSDSYGRARILAQSLLSETVSGWKQRLTRRQGRSGKFVWSVTITPAQEPWAALNTKAHWRLNRVQVTVAWDKNRRLQLETLKLDRPK
ncbi:hypothetical protein MnTg02_02520 [bacterium MnTg02]|nr:hypothetical protein MnTg02_02520 [bacterium MnTg02]